jgi:hypothetical protein
MNVDNWNSTSSFPAFVVSQKDTYYYRVETDNERILEYEDDSLEGVLPYFFKPIFGMLMNIRYNYELDIANVIVKRKNINDRVSKIIESLDLDEEEADEFINNSVMVEVTYKDKDDTRILIAVREDLDMVEKIKNFIRSFQEIEHEEKAMLRFNNLFMIIDGNNFALKTVDKVG